MLIWRNGMRRTWRTSEYCSRRLTSARFLSSSFTNLQVVNKEELNLSHLALIYANCTVCSFGGATGGYGVLIVVVTKGQGSIICRGMDQVDRSGDWTRGQQHICIWGQQLLVEEVPGDGGPLVRRQERCCSVELGGGGAPAGDVDEPPPRPGLLLRHRPANCPGAAAGRRRRHHR